MSSKRDTEAKNGEKSLLESLERGSRARWWRRRGSKERGFWYEDHKGRRITDETQLERIRSLVLPPAWKHVRISPSSRSAIQAVGVDKIGRMQYKYCPLFAARQQQKKFKKIERFGEHLHSLRRLTNEHIGLEGFPRERVLAVIIRLINDLYLRVGSEDSVKRYRTYGVTTLRNRHLEIKPGGQLVFSFVGKHHIRHRRIIVDEELAAVMRDLKALGGPKLFEYVGEDGRIRPVTPRDVNEYIKVATTPEFSAKDFRTWGGTLMAAMELAEAGKPESERQAKRNIVQAVKRVAEHLGNTPTVCRNCYVHPAIFDRYVKGLTLEEFRPKSQRYIRRLQPEYEPEELALLKLLRAGANGRAASNVAPAEKHLARQAA
ncbi:MAG TPA: DNA topoisomerase IB [Blastocatellia bacterium]|jgi:DNA topoisomerase-1|nr:DNA topoisomerase IB [Blastocatellia bacterium]